MSDQVDVGKLWGHAATAYLDNHHKTVLQCLETACREAERLQAECARLADGWEITLGELWDTQVQASDIVDFAATLIQERDAAREELADLRQYHADYSEHTAAAHRVMVETVEGLEAVLSSIAEQATQQYEMTAVGRVLRQIEQCARRALEGN